ncbi:DinB family protein [Algoriphagus sp. AGSA1]|uniref:DinB family protein n=1 Tax=Algoriphagus sp. AGSA1 TaxID=2907213 RepID=UPI001F429FF2|nr:DinB family protein [Algoriphagus sp. AGSA1]MCE7055539.1 DinB family protein [Algoriphagus sp. AGSA1]
MKESQRIRSLFSKQYNQNPWIGVNFVDKLAQITPELAAYKFSPKTNSIWEILNHLISWRELVLEGIHKNTYSSPSHNFFLPIKDPSEEEWNLTLDRLHASQEAWLEYFSSFEEGILEKKFGDHTYTYYELILGVLHHDIYHLGQIALLARVISESSKGQV